MSRPGKWSKREKAREACSHFLELQLTPEAETTSLARVNWSIKLFYRPPTRGVCGRGSLGRPGLSLHQQQGQLASQDGSDHLVSTQEPGREPGEVCEDTPANLGGERSLWGCLISCITSLSGVWILPGRQTPKPQALRAPCQCQGTLSVLRVCPPYPPLAR